MAQQAKASSRVTRTRPELRIIRGRVVNVENARKRMRKEVREGSEFHGT